MKRTGNVYQQIISLENLRQADEAAQRGKSNQRGIIIHNENRELNILALHKALDNKIYKTSRYRTFTIYEKKKREISSLPYYPDRILHHAIVRHIAPILTKSFIVNTYSCIKYRGVHKCVKDVGKALKDRPGTKYCLKLDIRKFYPSIDHSLLKQSLRSKFKDPELLGLLDEIIDSNEKGVPLGNYLSQWFANFFLNPFDHWLKEDKQINHYFRYCDDVVILHHNKEFLHQLRVEIQQYLHTFKLELSNYQVFPVSSRGIDFGGYKSYHEYRFLRKSIKERFRKMLRTNRNERSIASYNGWLAHGNCKHLKNKLLKR